MLKRPPPSAPPGKKDKGDSKYLGWGADEQLPQGFAQINPFGGKNQGLVKGNDARFTRYKTGDEWAPAGGDPNQIYAIQQALETAGYLTDYRAYYWDGNTAKAFREVLSEANRNGISWQEALDRGIAGYAVSGATQKVGNRQLPVFTVANAGDLRDVFKQVSQSTIGHYISDEELDSMVLSYQQIQLGSQQRQLDIATQEQAAREAGEMGFGAPTVEEDVANPQDWARRWYEGAHPNEAGATRGAAAIQSTLEFLRGGS